MAEYYPDQLQYELTCSICLGLFDTPVTLFCDHSFCKICLEDICFSNGIFVGSAQCPVCRKPIDLGSVEMKTNIVLKRIIDVYKDDLPGRMGMSRSCMDLSTNHNRPESRILNPLPKLKRITDFCQPYGVKTNLGNPVRPSDSVLELREVLNPVDGSTDGAYLTKCTSDCSKPPRKASILCVHCKNQYCRLCWEERHSLDDERYQYHNLNVYITTFQDEQGTDIECNVCDPTSTEPAKFICFHCNMNFCENCYSKRHPVLLIQHFIVKRPEFIPIHKPCSVCTSNPPNLATLICNECKTCFCVSCLPKTCKHLCLKKSSKSNMMPDLMDMFSVAERQIQRELMTLMKLKKQLIDEIPRLFKIQKQQQKAQLKLGERVTYFYNDDVHNGVTRWIGQLPDTNDQQITVGVEFDDPVGNGDGIYKGQRLFECKRDCAEFIPILELIKEADVNEVNEEKPITTEVPSHVGVPAQEFLSIGDYVAFPYNDRFCKGCVKWIGLLPDNTDKKDLTVGVEFDEPIGSGTGKYKNHRLFYTKENHAALVPVCGLMRHADLEK